MTFLRSSFNKATLFTRSLSILKSSLKVSPAALWHANALGISLEMVKGTGPKGHILKSDVLNHSKDNETESRESSDMALLLEIPQNYNDLLIKKCLESITKGKQIEFEYKLMSEIGLLQVKMKQSGISMSGESENIKNLLKVYLNDSIHLLL